MIRHLFHGYRGLSGLLPSSPWRWWWWCCNERPKTASTWNRYKCKCRHECDRLTVLRHGRWRSAIAFRFGIHLPDSPLPPISKILVARVGTGLCQCYVMPLSQFWHTQFIVSGCSSIDKYFLKQLVLQGVILCEYSRHILNHTRYFTWKFSPSILLFSLSVTRLVLTPTPNPKWPTKPKCQHEMALPFCRCR